MLDFGSLPPEVNSGRMYTGPGAGPMLAAAAGWNDLAAELESTTAGYSSVISELTGQAWSGPTSLAMTAAVTPYVAWLSVTGAAAVHTSAQAYAAAAAYEAAFAMTVPPEVIAANRAQLMALIATNFFGQNAPAIAVTEAHYMQMWAQDTAAMYGYAAASHAARTLTPFNEPPRITNPAGQGAQAGNGAHAAAGAAGTHTAHTLCQSTLPAATHQVGSTSIAPGSIDTAGTHGATIVLDCGSVTIGQGSSLTIGTTDTVTNAGAGCVTLNAACHPITLMPGASLTYSALINMQIPPDSTFTVTGGPVVISSTGPTGSIILPAGGTLTGAGTNGATFTITSGGFVIPSIAPITPITPIATGSLAPAAPAAATTVTTATTAPAASTASTAAAVPPGVQQAPQALPQSAPGEQQPPGVSPHPAGAPPHPAGAPHWAAGGAGGSGDRPHWPSGEQQHLGALPHSAPGEQQSWQPSTLRRMDQASITTAMATLLGAGVGGFTTYVTSKAAFNRGEVAEAKRQHEALMRDVSVRFVKTLDRMQGEIGSSKSKELSSGFDELVSSNQDVRNLFEQVKAGTDATTPEQALEILRGAAEPAPPALEQIAAATFREVLDAAPQMAELNSIIAEMKLIMPRDILLKAQYAEMVTLFMAHISDAIPPTSNWNQASSAAVSDFVGAVRSHFGLDPISLA